VSARACQSAPAQPAAPRCGAQKAHTAGLAAYLPSFLPALFPRPGALLQLLVDPERHILYARGQAAAVQAWLRALPQGLGSGSRRMPR